MNPLAYAQLAQRTAAANLPESFRLAIAGLGMGGEAGEVADIVKKYAAHGHDLDKDKLSKEIGDVEWYIVEICTLSGVSFTDIVGAGTRHAERYFQVNVGLEYPPDPSDELYPLVYSCHEMIVAAGKVVEYCHDHSDGAKKASELEQGLLKLYLSRVQAELVIMTTMIGLTIGEIMQRNIDKLKARYPEGFKHSDSVNRTDE